MPLSRRLPKYGFHNPFREEFHIVNIGSLERCDAGSVVDSDLLVKLGLVKNSKKKIKILADGTLTKALTVKAQAFSKQAQEKITASGGTVEVV